MDGGPETYHGTAVALRAAAVLIVGASGSGKSDLALRCMALAPSSLITDAALLVADDRVRLQAVGGELRVEAPETIRGKLEVRGQGIVTVPFVASARLALIAELVPPEAVERLPDPEPHRNYFGHEVPLLRLAPFEASAPVKLLLALQLAAL